MPVRVDDRLIERLDHLPDPEATGVWPVERLELLRDAGIFRWGLPEDVGGLSVTEVEMLHGYIELSRVCLTTAFILTQRNAACHRIASCDNADLRNRLLPDHCLGRSMATVGISHLSTSRQHWSRPSVVAKQVGDDFVLTGEAPWVTGANHADLLVTGATLPDGDQILVAIPTAREEVTVGEPLRLLALNGSQTGSVLLTDVKVRRDEVVSGPCPQVMKIGATGGTGSLTTTAIAMGASYCTLDELKEQSESRARLAPIVQSFTNEFARLKDRLFEAAVIPDAASAKMIAEELRFGANSLATRTAQALMACAKGMGYVSGSPAERAIRAAMFFHVWSCPPAVTEATLAELTRH